MKVDKILITLTIKDLDKKKNHIKSQRSNGGIQQLTNQLHFELRDKAIQPMPM